ncbi:molybdate ABC transporter substrate-binding protein [Falsibacillus albus]|uniref:Molybdate ABC transporter substrate-binding protein n=1 Tax=Falsibacillus albus TaxID=2478915 RepID=A0A3L7K4Z9_9BACI|nr:molybdate ABC transporter substrate-binding protein [Falsibacillus albus]RLQ97349.1 molybdate ABC transporter substrate-binding protein [Falsibacillus albus]
MIKKYQMAAAIVIMLTIALSGCSSKEDKKTITISAAASLNDVLSELADDYEESHPDQKVQLNFGGSGALSQQIIHGAPVDVFISAAEEPISMIQQKGLMKKKSILFNNQLVLIIPTNSTVGISDFKDLTAGEVKKIAVGTPKAVPAGTYAKETLTSLGIWDQLQSRLVYGKDVRQVLQYVETANVDAGIVYYTDALTTKKVKVVAKAKSDWHSPIVYYGGVLDASKEHGSSKEFLKYLKSKHAKSIYSKYGFSMN